MDRGVVVIREERREEERRRLIARFIVAVLLDVFTGVCKKTGHVAHPWALELNLWAHLCFTLVTAMITFAPTTVVELMRKIREECDKLILLGFLCLMASLSFSACLGLGLFVDV
ncbi:uncharacterized protein LOC111828592 [Capsella rubella]|uniref:uncharacterized protein LOC111828592 n=1 Tax=Capsella rubella TaxID=81985 RepID=UPI000CD4CF68|nr:uncharacterized protein LOC111828592 [Capsella rubella]